MDCKSRHKNFTPQIIRNKFSTFSLFSKNPVQSSLFRDEIGCKDRKSFGYRNSIRKKYHACGRRFLLQRVESYPTLSGWNVAKSGIPILYNDRSDRTASAGRRNKRHSRIPQKALSGREESPVRSRPHHSIPAEADVRARTQKRPPSDGRICAKKCRLIPL